MSGPVTVVLQRAHSSQSWGFRLQGGRDFRQELSVKKVGCHMTANCSSTSGFDYCIDNIFHILQKMHSIKS